MFYLLTYKVNSIYLPLGVDRSSIGLSGSGYGGARLPVSGGK